jgi:AraC-like DNA-binding protein
MRPAVLERDEAALWDIAVPSRRSPLAGVSMAGFGHRTSMGPIDLHALPHPAVTLAVEFGDGPFVLDDASGRQYRGSFVAGLTPGDIRVRGNDIQCVQVRLSPLVAHSVLGASPLDINGAVVTLDHFWGNDAEPLRERLHDAASWEDRFAIIDAALIHRYDTGPSVAPEIIRAWKLIVSNHGQVRVDNLAVDAGWSRKRLWSRFRAQIGLTPKRAARLARFDHAAHRLAAGVGAAQVAAEGGYVDQSHLHRDVQLFAGMTPIAVAGAPWLTVDDTAWPNRVTPSST